MSSTTLPVCPKTGSTSPSLTVHLCLHTAPGNRECALRYYGKRWGIEAGFRDIKDMRFGMGLSSMHVSRPDRRDRLLLISALAIAVLSLLGAAGERIGYDRWLKANTVKRRTHSLFRQGLMLYHHLPNWPEDRIRPLMETFGNMLMEQRVYREVFGVI